MLNTVTFAGNGSPFGSTVAPDNTLYVTVSTANVIRHLNEAGTILGSFSTTFTPGDVVVAADGTLYVTNRFGGTVVHYSAAGVLLNQFSTSVGNFFDGLALAADGNSLYATGENSTSLFNYSLTGTLLGQFALSSPKSPTFLNVVPNAFAPAVPEPGSVALLIGLATTGAGFLSRRRRKQAQNAA